MCASLSSALDYGNLAQIASAIVAAFAVLVAIFKDTILGWVYKPILVPRLRMAPPDCHKTTIMSGNVSAECYYCRLWVANEGNARANNVQVYAKELRGKFANSSSFIVIESFLPMNLPWSYADTATGKRQTIATGIPRKMGKHCDVLHIIEPNMTASIYRKLPSVYPNSIVFDLEFQSAANNFVYPAGDYQLDILIVADNFAPRVSTIYVSYNGTWSINEHIMLQNNVQIDVR